MFELVYDFFKFMPHKYPCLVFEMNVLDIDQLVSAQTVQKINIDKEVAYQR